MRRTFLFVAMLLFLCSNISIAKVELTENDKQKLISLAEFYSKDVNFYNKQAAEELEQFRTPELNQVVTAMKVVAARSEEIFSRQYLSKPSYNDLVLWYVIRQIHYNLTDKDNTPVPNAEVADKWLNEAIDERALLDNYYYRIRGAVSFLHNDKDLSKYNIIIDSLGLETPVEKAIFYLNFTDAFIQRFQVLLAVKNSAKIIEFAKRMPAVNGKPYYYFTDFNYDDFKWIGYIKIENYNERHINNLYNSLFAHFNALLESKNKKHNEQALQLYKNSILNKPEYFRYSTAEDQFQKLHTVMKNK